ncbi:hypothetical protein [Roseobacter sinensis]|uniref:Uncharacterized protein n=1 Tax=Roseobacter sinensis TaxID=2931391 RepID=A0ABT3BB03_9RHOB|nr:hypothetical protein [Roseobacter sp. WL0113]MCV3270761.1 hypothetical protein [Roseobacter sp. WL0113]
MKYETITETKVAHSVLGLDEKDVAAFVWDRVKDRSLSKLMADLNRDMLSGTERERQDAERALSRLGFL